MCSGAPADFNGVRFALSELGAASVFFDDLRAALPCSGQGVFNKTSRDRAGNPAVRQHFTEAEQAVILYPAQNPDGRPVLRSRVDDFPGNNSVTAFEPEENGNRAVNGSFSLILKSGGVPAFLRSCASLREGAVNSGGLVLLQILWFFPATGINAGDEIFGQGPRQGAAVPPDNILHHLVPPP